MPETFIVRKIYGSGESEGFLMEQASDSENGPMG